MTLTIIDTGRIEINIGWAEPDLQASVPLRYRIMMKVCRSQVNTVEARFSHLGDRKNNFK